MWRPESNRRQRRYECRALPTELHQHRGWGPGGEPSPLIKYVLKSQAPPLPVYTRCCLPASLPDPGSRSWSSRCRLVKGPPQGRRQNRRARHRLTGRHITNDTHRGMLIRGVSRPSSAARSSLLSSGVPARPEVHTLLFQMPIVTEIPGDRGPRGQTQHRSEIRGYINAQRMQ